MIIAVDGPLASGKGTIARALAAELGLAYLDTGSLYRAVAVCILQAGKSLDDRVFAQIAADQLDIKNIDETKIRTAEVGAAASIISSYQGVRDRLLNIQKDFAHRPGGAVLDGRDIGTVIVPEADIKLFITADEKVRAHRRHAEFIKRGEAISFESVLEQLQQRDRRDSGRVNAPLVCAKDAKILDTSELDIETAIKGALLLVRTK